MEKRREEAVLRGLEESEEDFSERGTVILIVSGTMHQLNLVGGKIWQLCDGNRSVDQVVDALADEFDIDREELAGDVQGFIDDLLQRGWLRHG